MGQFRESLLDRPEVVGQQKRLFRGLFRIVPTDLSVRRRPLRHESLSFRHILILGTKKSAGISGQSLYLARPLEPRFFVSLQPLGDVLSFDAFQKYCEREAIFDCLRGALAEMWHHRVGSVTEQRHPTGRPIWQGCSIINAPAKCRIESAYCF